MLFAAAMASEPRRRLRDPPDLPPSPRHPKGARAGHDEKGVSRGFRDTRDTKTEVDALGRRAAAGHLRGAQGELGAEPVATADLAPLGRRVVYAILSTFNPLPHISALAHRAIRARRRSG